MKMRIEKGATKTLFLIILIALSCLVFPGCGGEETIEQNLHLDFSNPYYKRASPSEAWASETRNIAAWTPTSEEVGTEMLEDDLEGALDILYQDILDTNPHKQDHFFYAVKTFNVLFYDPKTVLELYRDADRSGWSEDEKAAADLIVALTYENGDFDDALPPEYYTDVYGPGVVQEELFELAGKMYAEIAEKYEDGKVAVLAKIALASWLSRHNREDSTILEKINDIKDEIEHETPDSTYLTKMQMIISAYYYTRAFLSTDKAYANEQYMESIDQYERVSQTPDYFNVSLTPGCDTAHEIAESRIEEIRNELDAYGQ